MQLVDYITVDRILPEMQAQTKDAALAELAGLFAERLGVGTLDQICKVLGERELLASTGIGDQVAIPHGKVDAAGGLLLGLGRSRRGVDFDSVDGKPARLFFVVLAPGSATGLHLKALARISRICRESDFRKKMLKAKDPETMLDILRQEDSKFGPP